MAELDERLNRLISDQESMKRVLDVANAILAQRNSASPESAKQEPPPKEGTVVDAPPGSDMAAMLAALLPQNSGAGAADTKGAAQSDSPDPSPGAADDTSSGVGNMAGLAAVLPQLLQAFSGNGNLVKSERVNLLRAMRPYLADKRLGSIDRALKMANMTQAAKSALHLLGR